MKVPMIDKCPCCGARLGQQTLVKAICKQSNGPMGELLNALLYWECISCGCEWKHGQFSKDSAA